MIEPIRRAVNRIAEEREALLGHGLLRPVAGRLSHPSLWHVSRRSAMRAVPLGLIIAFTVPLGQVIVAAFAALYVRAHIPIAAAITFVTNPLTLPFIYYAAYRAGAAILPGSPAFTPAALTDPLALPALALPILLGFAMIGVAAASIGYLGASLWWRTRLAQRWRRRKSARRA